MQLFFWGGRIVLICCSHALVKVLLSLHTHTHTLEIHCIYGKSHQNLRSFMNVFGNG